MADLAARQAGVVGWAQLRELGLGKATITRWVDSGRLHRVHPGVYAVGHQRLALAGRLQAALLYSGPGAVLSHTTAAWLWGLFEAVPRRIHVTAAARRRPLASLCAHRTQRVEVTIRSGFAVTPVSRTLLDPGSVLPSARLLRVLAEAEFRGLLDSREVERELGRGRPGSAALRSALDQHLPSLAETRSALEERFLVLCRRSAIELPLVNARVAGMVVDALWPRHRLVVELDGQAAHAPAARVVIDRDRELRLRRAGFVILRYSWEQLVRSPEIVREELRSRLSAPD